VNRFYAKKSSLTIVHTKTRKRSTQYARNWPTRSL